MTIDNRKLKIRIISSRKNDDIFLIVNLAKTEGYRCESIMLRLQWRVSQYYVLTMQSLSILCSYNEGPLNIMSLQWRVCQYYVLTMKGLSILFPYNEGSVNIMSLQWRVCQYFVLLNFDFDLFLTCFPGEGQPIPGPGVVQIYCQYSQKVSIYLPILLSIYLSI